MYSSQSAISAIRSAGAAWQGSPVGRRNPADAWRRSGPPLKAQNAFVRSAIITLVSLSVIACVLELSGLLDRSEEHTSELQSLTRISYAVFCLKKKTIITNILSYCVIFIVKLLRTLITTIIDTDK